VRICLFLRIERMENTMKKREPYESSFGLTLSGLIGSGFLGPVWSKWEPTRPVIPMFNLDRISKPKQMGTFSWEKKGKISNVCLILVLL
jgi:hypothetical protein